MQNPIYTEITSCRDCYKCVRSCPVKAIQIKDGHAMIIKDRCIYCGRCVHVCPNSAKKVREDADRVKLAISSGRRVITIVNDGDENSLRLQLSFLCAKI